MNRLFQLLSAVPNTFLLSWGWQRRGLSVFSGALAAFALPPYDLIPVLFLSFSGFIWLLDGALTDRQEAITRRLRIGFSIGWFFGFGYFLSGLWWVGSAFLVEADRYAWLMPLAVLAMPVGLAIFTGLGTALAACLWSDGRGRLLVLAACLTISDWVRGAVFTGFPWNSFGYALSGSLPVSQVASVVGIFGLSFLVVAIFGSVAMLADAQPFRRRALPLTIALFAIASLYGGGALRLSGTGPVFTDLDVRIVQPSIRQEDKWQPELRDEIFQTLLDMSEAPLGGQARVGAERLVVWPETAVPFLLTQEPGALLRIARALGDNAELVTGAVRTEIIDGKQAVFNSVFRIDNSGAIAGLYDKVRLVPFGEFVPFREFFLSLGVGTLAGPMEGFESGFHQRPVSTAVGLSFLPLICYEVIFPHFAQDPDESASFLLNVTNDAWFGRTPGPFQHFSQARMRSIESGLPLIRSANTGISGVVDGYGRVITQQPIFERGVIDHKLPQGIGRTVYSRYGDIPILSLVFLIVIITSVPLYNRNSRKN